MDVKSASFDDIPGSLPIAAIPPDTDTATVAAEGIRRLNAWGADDLTEEAIWRDFISLTGTYRTFFSRDTIHGVFSKLTLAKKCFPFELVSREPRIDHCVEDSNWIDVDFKFQTHEGYLSGNAEGTVSLVFCSDGKWRIWMIRTWLECFDGYGNPDTWIPFHANDELNGSAASQEAINGNRVNGTAPSKDEVLDLAIVGGGQGGLSLAGRAQAVGLDYILLERNSSIGDVWKSRYESLSWHTPKQYGELPFGQTFDHDDPVLIPTKRIAAAHKTWAARYGIQVRTDCNVERAEWDDSSGIWTIRTSKGTVLAMNLVICIGGGSASPVFPPWATPEKVKLSQYSGTLIHGADYHDCHKYAGKRAVVVGTANTGHDVADDMVRANMDTTILQRGATFVMPIEWLHGGMAPHYNDELPTERGDREAFTLPNKTFREVLNRNVHSAVDANAERFDALERAGFQLDRYGDLATNLYVRLGGHYIDHGCSAKIANGQIRVVNKGVDCLTQSGLRFVDGSEIEVDLIVCCTGFDHDFRRQTRGLIGDIADEVDPYLGVDAEGEIRGLSKPSGHPHLYYHGGDVRAARWFSRFIALRIQAEKLGVALELYRD